jgi:tetratricopeptide (TPR) repeat protein
MTDKITSAELFERGVQLLRESDSLGALACFEKAYLHEQSPRIRSYLGYCIAAQRGQIGEALRLCMSAIEAEPGNPEHYLNLGRVHLRAKRRDEALETLRKGLSAGDNADIKALLEDLGTRKRPLLPFLPRHHFLNKYAGLILRLLKLR